MPGFDWPSTGERVPEIRTPIVTPITKINNANPTFFIPYLRENSTVIEAQRNLCVSSMTKKTCAFKVCLASPMSRVNGMRRPNAPQEALNPRL
jgi:hypothetical protein